MDRTQKKVLLTGASGGLGRQLAAGLSVEGIELVLTDRAPFPDSLPQRATFTQADLDDGVTMLRLAEGCGTILHFGGISVERPFEEIVGPNLRGLYHVYEAARREGARVVFASSNHAIGFHERSNTLDSDCAFRPDGYYGLSKAYGELMGRLYWDKHGVESVMVRIGSSWPEPIDARMLSTWLSYADLMRLILCSIRTERVDYAVVWGASNNARSFWRDDDRARLGWQPADSADVYASQLHGKISDNPVQERFQGGAFAAQLYTRSDAEIPPTV